MGMAAIVKTGCGSVRGTTDGGVTVFKGIPYAAPLDGPRRFQAPLPPPRWDGVRDATAFGPAAPQPGGRPGTTALWRPGDSTDYLTVNVWTPDPGARLPVMVWLHGGAFVFGSAGLPEYDGANLARGGVVVVTLNYRLGFDGFGWLPDAPANRAHLDQLAALGWVRDNIAGFGGDPGAVTVFGESAGATAVAVLTAAEAGRGLFRRAIGQSVAGSFLPEKQAREVSERIAKELGTGLSAEAFGEVEPEAIVRAQALFEGITPYGPVIDGDLVTDAAWHGLRGEVELVTGFNRDEFRLFTQLMGTPAGDPAALGLPPAALAAYRAACPGLTEDGLAEVILSDRIFRMPSLWCAQRHPGRRFLYELTWPSPALGACHGLDVPLTFGNLDAPLATMMFGGPAPAEAELLSNEMRKAWTSFATTGDPGWPEYRPEEALARIWDVPVSLRADPEAASRRIWHELSQRRPAAT
jgi:para-nitrobenzyl esterase